MLWILGMSKKRLTSIFSLTVLFALMMTPHAEAKIPIRAFKNVTKHFKEGQQFNSPTFGEAALYSGFIYDLRFYGNIEPFFKEEKRRYIGDEGLDSLAMLVRDLFPSPTGALNVETTGKDNFGRYVDKPETVALLVNFAHKMRNDEKFSEQQITDYGKEILATCTLGELNKNDSKDLRSKINGILKSIQQSISEESQGPYPKYMTEQVITAYFCEKFSTQSHIWALLRAMDDNIVDKRNIPQEDQKEELLEEDNLKSIANKEAPYDADDIFALENADIFGAITPYKPGAQLISNGNTRPYDRNNDKDLSEDPFADCAEMAARHVMNLLLFNDETQQFDLSHLKSHIKENNPYFKNFEGFYAQQTPLLTNAGDTYMRSLWARVLGDLNTDADPIKISYLKGTYELNPGYINFVRAFQKVFGLTLEELPQNANLEVKKDWLEKSLTTLFKTVNPTKKYEFDLSKVTDDGNDLSGHLRVEIKNKSDEELFSFTYSSAVGLHSDVRELQIPKTASKHGYHKRLQAHATMMTEEGTAKDAIWLALPEPMKPRSDFYKLFHEHLSDNDSRIKSLRQIPLMDKDNKLMKLLPRILKNILADISWEDRAVISKASPVVSVMMKDENFRDVIAETVKGFYLNDDDDLKNPYLQLLFERITTLRGGQYISSLTGLEACKELKRLYLAGTAVRTLNELNTLSKLETLNLSDTEIEELSLENLTQLKILLLYDSAVKTLKGLNTLVSLETLNLSYTKNLEELSLENLPKLKSLNFNNSAINTLSLNTLLSLESLDLGDTTKLEDLSLENLPQLNYLNLHNSTINTLKGLNTLMSLEELRLSNTSHLKELSLENLTQLKTLYLDGSTVNILTGLNTLLSLETLRLMNTYKIEELSLENLPQLKRIQLQSSSIKTLSLKNLLSLESLDLGESKNLEKLSLESLPRLKSLTLHHSAVKNINGLNTLLSLKTLDLSNTQIPEELSLVNLTQLHRLFLNRSSFKTLTGLNTLSKLEILELENAYHLQSLEFTEDMKDLKITLTNSGITHRNQITGFEHLDEKNITW